LLYFVKLEKKPYNNSSWIRSKIKSFIE